jgi:hypothetical protein
MAADKGNAVKQYLFGDKYLFSILPNQQRARSDFCLILYVVNYCRVGKYIMRKSKRYNLGLRYENSEEWSATWTRRRATTYLFDFRRINVYFLFCRTNNVRDLIFV